MGSIRFDVPFAAPSIAVVSEAAGLMSDSDGQTPRTAVRTTVIDTSDHRLLRSGIVLAHHLSESVGHWSLEAPAWAPRIPAHAVEPVGRAMDLPDTFGRLIRPITRGRTLGPVAVLETDRLTRALRARDGAELACLRDDSITIRREDGPPTRYREVVVEPTPAMTPQQFEFVITSLAAAEGSPTRSFPTLQQRLGPPASGLTDFPAPWPLGKDATMEELVTAVFADDLRELTFAMLDLQASPGGDAAALRHCLVRVRRHLRGLAHVLEPSWRESFEADLPADAADPAAGSIEVGLATLDALVGAVRAPRLGDQALEPAGQLLFRRADQAFRILADRCDALTVDSPEGAWRAALMAAEQLEASADVALALPGRVTAKLARRLWSLCAELSGCIESGITPSIEGLGPDEAFEVGRAEGRAAADRAAARRRFTKRWPEWHADVRRLHTKAGA